MPRSVLTADPVPPTLPPADPSAVSGPHQPVSRRSIIRALGLGAATVLVAGTGLLGYRVYDTAVLKPGSGAAYDPWQQWREDLGPLGAVAAAILAANPHNTQPWIFAVAVTTIDVYADPTRTIGTIDAFLREQHVGLGCALENLVLACRARSLEPDVELLPDPRDETWVARLTLVPSAATADDRYEAIGSRHTDRGPYDTREVLQEDLAQLVDTAELTGADVHWVTRPTDVAAMGELLVDAAAAVIADEDQSRDGFAWFRGSDDEVQLNADGLTLDAQGLSPLLLSAAKLLPASSRSAGDAFWVDQTRDVHTKTAKAYGVIVVAGPDDRAVQLTAGRLLQRIHLTATSRGISLQHMNQITERIDREQVTGAPASFGPRFAEFLPPEVAPLVTFRVGYPTQAVRPSPRRALAAVIA